MEKYKLSVIVPVWNQQKLITRALESIPAECEVIVINDGSTDRTLKEILKYENNNSWRDIHIINNDTNLGVSASVNRGLNRATGDYVVLLGSDDYFYTTSFYMVMEEMDGTDLIYFDLETNDGTIFHLDDESKYGYCGSVKLMRRDFIGDIRNKEDVVAGEDWHFFRDIMKLNPTEKFTNIVAKHYNFPREGSLSYQNSSVVKE